MLRRFRNILRFCTPYGIVEGRRRTRASPLKTSDRERFHAKRHELIAATAPAVFSCIDFEYEQAVTFLVGRGLNEHHVREGSIPSASLKFVEARLLERYPTDQPLVALHIGNFVGISLAALTSIVTSINPNSLVMAVDPNLPHRGISSPQDHVMALLARVGLQRHVIPIVGYSLGKSVSNDGVNYDDMYDPAEGYGREFACENVIENIEMVFGRCVDMALVDGNHEASYLRSEIGAIGKVMRPGGVVILDDVDEAWVELKDVYTGLQVGGWLDLGTDGRVGLLQVPVSA